MMAGSDGPAPRDWAALIVVIGVALAGGLWLLRQAPPLLGVWSAASADGGRAQPDRASVRRYMGWFVHMRWIALLTGAVLVVAAVTLGYLPGAVAPALLLTLTAVGAANLGYVVRARRGGAGRRWLVVSLYVDLAALIVLLHLSGGIENPLYLLPVFNVILAGIALGRRECFKLAVAGGLLCGGAVWAEWARLIPHYTLTVVPHGGDGHLHAAYDGLYVAARASLQLLVLTLTAHFVSLLAEQSRSQERALWAAADDARAEQELLEQALDRTDTGLRLMDTSLGTLTTNAVWRRWFPAGEDAWRRLADRTAEDGSPARRTLEDGRAHREELGVPGVDAPRVLRVTVAPLHGAGGDTERLAELVQDVTSERRAQAEALEAGRLATVGELAGRFAHEVNNPVSIVIAKARLLLTDRRSEMSAKVAHELERILDLGERVARIAQDLLAYGRPTPSPRSRIDLRAPLRECLDLVAERAADRGVRLDIRPGSDALWVDASATEMQQVFLNLAINALDAMPDGGVLTAEAALDAGDGAPYAVIAIRDTGPGIPAELCERVFEPFFTTKPASRGGGLGLSVCQGLVRSHGGAIRAERAGGGGTRMVVSLPVIRSEGG